MTEDERQALIVSFFDSIVMPALIEHIAQQMPVARPGDSDPISSAKLSARTYNGLVNGGLLTVGDVLALSDRDLLSIKNFGRKSLNEVREAFGASRIPPGKRTRPANWYYARWWAQGVNP